MRLLLCYLVFMVNPLRGMEHEQPIEIKDDKSVVLDINDPEIQSVIKKVVSATIHEAFKNKQLQEELENKKKCCNSDTKVRAALATALCSVITALATLVVNNQ